MIFQAAGDTSWIAVTESSQDRKNRYFKKAGFEITYSNSQPCKKNTPEEDSTT